MNREQAALAAHAEHWSTPPAGGEEAAERARTRAGLRDAAAEGAVLRLLARVSGARAAVTATTTGGVLPLWILQGMPTDGALSCIDDEAAASLTRQAIAAAGVPQHRWRIMAGRPTEVMVRLRDRAYDLVVLDAEAEDLPQQMEQARRLARPGALVAMVGAGLQGRLADPVRRDPATLAVRAVLDDWRSGGGDAVILPVGAGVAAAVLP